ncbi:MAG: NUDIX hydrolase [Oscillospiraceae bacterium]|nr:NUDIX hydrolase [Oscillospiraceae bacterium]
MEKTLKKNVIYTGRIINVRRDDVLTADGVPCVREVVEHPGATGIIAITDEGKILCVRQYRYPCGEYILEIPAGKLERGEEPLRCAKRELEEETGFTAARWDSLGSVYLSPGICDEKMHVFLARGLTPGEKCPDEDEVLENEYYTAEELTQMALRGELNDAKTFTALYMARVFMEREMEE